MSKKCLLVSDLYGRVSYQFFGDEDAADELIALYGMKLVYEHKLGRVYAHLEVGNHDSIHIVECESGQWWEFYRLDGDPSVLCRRSKEDGLGMPEDAAFCCMVYVP